MDRPESEGCRRRPAPSVIRGGGHQEGGGAKTGGASVQVCKCESFAGGATASLCHCVRLRPQLHRAHH
eukprot:64939-Prorocentrum_minimum.AAC.1